MKAVLNINKKERKQNMSAEGNSGYMLIFRGNDWHNGLSPEQMQQVANGWRAWFNNLSEQGVVVGGNPLENSGKIVSGKGGRVVVDGPFAESKEAIGGYFLLKVDTMDEAVKIAKDCPGLAHGVKVEVRPVMEKCPMECKVAARPELAGAAA
jgi:hypothetical protein